MTLTIRAETAADVPAIEAVTIAAFLDVPPTSHTEQRIIGALRKAGQLAISLVAEVRGIVTGPVAVSPVSLSDDAAGCVVLGEPGY